MLEGLNNDPYNRMEFNRYESVVNDAVRLKLAKMDFKPGQEAIIKAHLDKQKQYDKIKLNRDTQVMFDRIAIEIEKKYEERLDEAELGIIEKDNTFRAKKRMKTDSKVKKVAVVKYEEQKKQRIDSFN